MHESRLEHFILHASSSPSVKNGRYFASSLGDSNEDLVAATHISLHPTQNTRSDWTAMGDVVSPRFSSSGRSKVLCQYHSGELLAFVESKPIAYLG